MKTPMQEVYENFNLMSDADFKSWMLNTDLLEKEKEVMCEFAKIWDSDQWYWSTKTLEFKARKMEDCFDKAFNTKER